MYHQTILFLILCAAFLAAAVSIIKNRPQYLFLLGIRGLFTMYFIQLINYLSGLLQLPSILQANALSIFTGALLGLPGVVLLYLTRIYLL